MNLEDIDTPVRTATRAAAAYYSGQEPELTDAEYDALLDQIAAAADTDGDIAAHADVRALLDQVAAGTTTTAGTKVTHTSPMLSLTKVRTIADIDRLTDKLSTNYVVEAKLDGSAIAARYENGHLVQVATRGDGVTGQDVTARCQHITGLPTKLTQPLTGQVRGEVYMTADDFTISQSGRTGAGREPFSNPRNATAGTIVRPDAPDYDVSLSFAAYDSTLSDDDSHTVRMDAAAAAGVYPVSYVVPLRDVNVPACLGVIEQARTTGHFPIDGAVIKADSTTDRDRLGDGSRAPRWAVAYKFEAKKATTVMTGIERTVGRTGNIAYTALLTPVEVDGSIVAKATLHNGDFIAENDLRVGDTVEVYKAGDIIPRVQHALVGLRPADAAKYDSPTTCPTCDETLDQSGVIWKCVTPTCSVAAALDYALSRDALDVDGFSVKVAEAVADAGLATDIGDLFALTAIDLADVVMGTTTTGNVRRLGKANANKIVSGIETAKTQPLNRVITALGIRGTGRGVSRRLADNFASLDAIYTATADELAAMPMGTYSSTGTPLVLGPAKGSLIADQLATDHYGTILGKLKAAGVTVEQATDEEETGTTGAALDGMSIVVTGSMKGTRLDGLARNEMNELIENAGGRAASSVSKTTSMLVCAEEGSSKWKRAVELDIRIVTPDEFADIVGH